MDWFRVFIRFAISNIVFGFIILTVCHLFGISNTIGILLITFSSTFYTCMRIAKKENEYFTEKNKLIGVFGFVLINLSFIAIISLFAFNRVSFNVPMNKFSSFLRVAGIIHGIVIFLTIELVNKLFVYENIKKNYSENLTVELLKNKKNALILTTFIFLIIHLSIGITQFTNNIIWGQWSHVIDNMTNFSLYSSAIWSNLFLKLDPIVNLLLAFLWSYSLFKLFKNDKEFFFFMKKIVFYSIIFFSIKILLNPIIYFSIISNFSFDLYYFEILYKFPNFLILTLYSFILYKGYKFSKIDYK